MKRLALAAAVVTLAACSGAKTETADTSAMAAPAPAAEATPAAGAAMDSTAMKMDSTMKMDSAAAPKAP